MRRFCRSDWLKSCSIARAAKQGVQQHHWPFGNMPPVEGITDAEIAVITAYIRAVQRANGIN